MFFELIICTYQYVSLDVSYVIFEDITCNWFRSFHCRLKSTSLYSQFEMFYCYSLLESNHQNVFTWFDFTMDNKTLVFSCITFSRDYHFIWIVLVLQLGNLKCNNVTLVQRGNNTIFYINLIVFQLTAGWGVKGFCCGILLPLTGTVRSKNFLSYHRVLRFSPPRWKVQKQFS